MTLSQTPDPDDILCWRRIDDRLTTSGQPNHAQMERLQTIGVRHLINLAPASNDGAMVDEPEVAEKLGFSYTYIPVDFEAPSEADFDAFCAALEATGNDKTHVHCIYNARVSAFFLRYAREERGAETVEDAFERMDSIWRPGEVWCRFIGLEQPSVPQNRYKGYEY